MGAIQRYSFCEPPLKKLISSGKEFFQTFRWTDCSQHHSDSFHQPGDPTGEVSSLEVVGTVNESPPTPLTVIKLPDPSSKIHETTLNTQTGDWLFSINLQDAYVHMLIHHRNISTSQ